jgi:hypothetical protein
VINPNFLPITANGILKALILVDPANAGKHEEIFARRQSGEDEM